MHNIFGEFWILRYMIRQTDRHTDRQAGTHDLISSFKLQKLLFLVTKS